MRSVNLGLHSTSVGEAIETVSVRGMEIKLLASYDGTEVIHHRLERGSRWVIGPSEGWDGLEFIFVLTGKMTCLIENNKITLQSGDHLNAIQMTEDYIFQAVEETEFLYTTSRPVFHQFSEVVQRLMDLTISVEEKDGYTAGHCYRIMNLSMKIGEQMKLSSNELYHLHLSAFLHDIGKLKIPAHILNKPQPLTTEEWEIMKMHPYFGKEIIEESNISYLMPVASIVVQHHERYNGSGYPNRLKKEEISIAAAIIAVADSFDAMTVDRVYRKGTSEQTAISAIEKSKGLLYHPEVVDHFIAIIADKN